VAAAVCREEGERADGRRWHLEFVHNHVTHGDEVDGDVDGNEERLQVADLDLREHDIH
jgi:hypothetical protein